MLRVKNAQARLAKAAPEPAPTPGLYMERSQSRISLSASFEALAIYFPCMNSFDEDDAGKHAFPVSFPKPTLLVAFAVTGAVWRHPGVSC